MMVGQGMSPGIHHGPPTRAATAAAGFSPTGGSGGWPGFFRLRPHLVEDVRLLFVLMGRVMMLLQGNDARIKKSDRLHRHLLEKHKWK